MLSFLYVLRLEGDNFYVGTTSSLKERYQKHLIGEGSECTRRFKPLSVVLLIPNKTKEDENSYVRKYMMRYGIDRVRGGTLSNLALTPEQRVRVENELNYLHGNDDIPNDVIAENNGQNLFIYVIRTDCGKFFVGAASNVGDVFHQHLTGSNPNIPRLPVPFDFYEITPNKTNHDVDIMVVRYMGLFGIDNVRGGTYHWNSSINEETVMLLRQEIWHNNGRCLNCGGMHFSARCPRTPMDFNFYQPQHAMLVAGNGAQQPMLVEVPVAVSVPVVEPTILALPPAAQRTPPKAHQATLAAPPAALRTPPKAHQATLAAPPAAPRTPPKAHQAGPVASPAVQQSSSKAHQATLLAPPAAQRTPPKAYQAGPVASPSVQQTPPKAHQAGPVASPAAPNNGCAAAALVFPGTGCTRCGRASHLVGNCFAKTHVNGTPLGNAAQQQAATAAAPPIPAPPSPARARRGWGHGCCFRCGRSSHWADECYASTDCYGDDDDYY